MKFIHIQGKGNSLDQDNLIRYFKIAINEYKDEFKDKQYENINDILIETIAKKISMLNDIFGSKIESFTIS